MGAARRPKLVVHVNGKVFKANLRPSITGAFTTVGVILNGLLAARPDRAGQHQDAVMNSRLQRRR